MHEPDGIGVHPLKLAHGYLRMARALGVKVHPASPVIGFETRNGVHHLKTPAGTVRARAVGFATGDYTSNGLLLDELKPDATRAAHLRARRLTGARSSRRSH